MQNTLETNNRTRLEKLGVVFFGFFIVLGLLLGFILANKTTENIKNALLIRASTIASFINPDDILVLQGNPNDVTNPKYLDLKSRLIEANSFSSDTRFIYIIGKDKTGQFFYYADSENPSSKYYSEPGKTYISINSNEGSLFERGLAYVEGPYKDSNGQWVTAYAPIRRSGAPLAKVGIDMPAEEYKSTWNSVFFSAFAAGVLVALLVLLFTVYLKKAIHLIRCVVSERALVENQKKNIEESNAKAGVGYFKWNRSTGDLMLSDFLLNTLMLERNISFNEFKTHVSNDEIEMLERKILEVCSGGGRTLVCELNYLLPTGNMKRLRMTCNFSQIYQNNPKFVEGTILQI